MSTSTVGLLSADDHAAAIFHIEKVGAHTARVFGEANQRGDREAMDKILRQMGDLLDVLEECDPDA